MRVVHVLGKQVAVSEGSRDEETRFDDVVFEQIIHRNRLRVAKPPDRVHPPVGRCVVGNEQSPIIVGPLDGNVLALSATGNGNGNVVSQIPALLPKLESFQDFLVKLVVIGVHFAGAQDYFFGFRLWRRSIGLSVSWVVIGNSTGQRLRISPSGKHRRIQSSIGVEAIDISHAVHAIIEPGVHDSAATLQGDVGAQE